MRRSLMIGVLAACVCVVMPSAAMAAFIYTDTYLVGDKDDFNNGDADGVFDLADGEYLGISYATYLTPEAGNTDYQMYPALGKVFDFTFTVDPLAGTETITGAKLRVVTFDCNDDSTDYYGGLPGAWGTQPIKVIQGTDTVVLGDKLAIDGSQRLVHIHEIDLPVSALALLEGGDVHVTIGTPSAIADWDVMLIDYAELEITGVDERGAQEPVSEAPAAVLLTIGLSGLARRKRR